MILAIERSSFNYLYKYNQIKVNPNSLMEISSKNLKTMRPEDILKQLERALPIFEEDHEILLLEVDKYSLEYLGYTLVIYSGVRKIYPLTSTGAQLLEGRLNQNISIGNPIFEDFIHKIRHNRSLENRLLAAKKLHSAFSLPTKIKSSDFHIIKETVSAILNEKKPSNYKFIYELISYNLTPSYVPEGNLEYLIKVSMIAIRAMGKDESRITQGPYYNHSISELRNARENLSETYSRFWSINNLDFISSANSVAEQARIDHKGVDMFKISYYYLAFKKLLQKNGNDLLLIAREVLILRREDDVVASWVLTLLGYSFSFEQLYESLHKIEVNSLDKIQLRDESDTKEKITAQMEILVGDTVEFDLNNKPNSTTRKTGLLIPSEEFEPDKINVDKDQNVKNNNDHSIELTKDKSDFETENFLYEEKLVEPELNSVADLNLDYSLTNGSDNSDTLSNPVVFESDGIDTEPVEIYHLEKDREIEVTKVFSEVIAKMNKKKGEKIIESLSKRFGKSGKINEAEFFDFIQLNKKLMEERLSESIQKLFKL